MVFQILFYNGRPLSNDQDPRFSLLDPQTLSIARVARADDGVYGCNVQDLGSASANLTVLCTYS